MNFTVETQIEFCEKKEHQHQHILQHITSFL